MMMKKTISFLAALCASQMAFAALPPLYQSANEIKTILSSKEFNQTLHSGEFITEIKKTKDGYELITNQNRVFVDVVFQPTSRPGPALFTVKFHEATPLNSN
jgi:hypothetical protein